MAREEVAPIARSRSGSLEELYAREAPRLERVAYLLTGDHHLAEDITQQAFVRFHARLGALRQKGAESAYLRRIVVNLARSHHRRRHREQEKMSAYAVPEASQPDDAATRHDISAALNILPYRQRAALVLRFYADLSEAQTAEALRCSPAAAKSLTARAMRNLREVLRGGDDG